MCLNQVSVNPLECELNTDQRTGNRENECNEYGVQTHLASLRLQPHPQIYQKETHCSKSLKKSPQLKQELVAPMVHTVRKQQRCSCSRSQDNIG
ncbi:MAG: hypothetical protein ABEJ72_02590, partial [Candidatus Aenigmatarchaeota archaeon]